ncbi:MAG: peptidyl-tRNA hydrolase [Candidatus Aenigmarchaeota archaeon]|nr:peptidyl-tRNA hydrolase [Candidatus Aenigmarchaeota archaeon]
MKQAILIRTDVRMSVGKKTVQACHASVGAVLNADKKSLWVWEEGGSKKIMLEARGENVLKDLQAKARKMGLPCFLVADAGLTELEPGTTTALAIGPGDDKKIDKLTGSIKLL